MTFKKLLPFLGIILLILAWSTLLYFFRPEDIVAFIGAEQGYFFAFLVAAIGGVSMFSTTSYYATILSLAAGGLNPFLLALVGGIGVTVGDTVFYYVGKKGRESAEGNWQKKFKRFSDWMQRQKRWKVLVIVYLYGGFTPLPADILSIALALAKIPLRQVLIPFICGNITLAMILTFLAQQGYQLF